MAETLPPDDARDLVEHARFVRAVARGLLRDEDDAEDVAQETLLAAVRAKPARDRSLRPWLAAVARNVVRKRFRGAERRRRREEAAARAERVPSVAQMAERGEMLRAVVEAVLALEEPNRSAVLLRYYEDLPPREIAARLGVGVETVRGRLKRAVAAMRARLDAGHPGGRRGWAPLLGALCGVEGPASPLAGPEGAATGAPGPVASAGAAAGWAAAAALLAGLAVGGGAGWAAFAPSSSEPPGPVAGGAVPGGAAGGSGAPATSASDAAAGEDLPGRVARAAARRRALVAERDLLLAALGGTDRAPGAAPARLRAGVPGPSPVLDGADWDGLAGHVLALQALAVDLRAGIVGGGEPPGDVLQRMTEHSQPLAAFAIAAAGELRADGANSAYTHPAVLANLIRAALRLRGEPLSREQEVALGALADAAADEEARAPATSGREVPALSRRLREAEAKLRFVRAARDLLTDAQRAVLFRAETEGRVQLDLLSPALLFPLRHPVVAPDEAELARRLVRELFLLAGIEETHLAPYEWVGRRWVEALAGVLPGGTADADGLAFPRIEVVLAEVAAQVQATERILAMGGLRPEAAGALRRVTMGLAPRLLPAAGAGGR